MATGDRPEEIERLYRFRFPNFLRVALAITGDHGQAVDAVQDGFGDANAERRAPLVASRANRGGGEVTDLDKALRAEFDRLIPAVS